MNILIPTIQHSGTKLIARMFHNYDWAGLDDNKDNAIYVGHISPGRIDLILDKMKEMPTIIPLRHPYLTQESWRLRGKSLSDLVDNWRLLVNQIFRHDPYFIAIDTDRRDDQLGQINLELGLTLENDWKVVNSVSNTYNLRYTDIEPQAVIKELVEEIHDFLKLYY